MRDVLIMFTAVTAFSLIAHATSMGMMLKEELIETSIGAWIVSHLPKSWLRRGLPPEKGGTGQIFVVPFITHIGSCLTCTTFWLNAASYAVWGLFNGYRLFDVMLIMLIALAVLVGQKIYRRYDR